MKITLKVLQKQSAFLKVNHNDNSVTINDLQSQIFGRTYKFDKVVNEYVCILEI